MESLGRRERIALGAVLVAALALRLLYVFGQRGDILFDYPVVDEERYVEMGRSLANGQVEPRAWLQPPGVVYALAVVFRLAGPGLTAPRVVQALVSSACCLFGFFVARRLFSTRVAFATAILCALHGVLVFEAYELLPPTWVMAADLLALWALLVAGERRTPARALVAGIALGVSAVFAPVVLPFVAVAAVWIRERTLVLALVAGVALPIAPVTWGNWQRGHEIVLVSTNGGVNFFIGNNPDYDATLALRPGEHWVELMNEPRRAGVTGSGSAYFYRKGLAFWRDHPARATALFVHKVWLYFGGAELPRDTDLYAARDESKILRALVTRGPPWLPDGLLVPLALVGAVASWRERRRLFVPYAFLTAQALVVAAFFVTSRYRVPALPVLAMFAVVGVASVRDAWHEQKGARRVGPILVFAVLAVVLNLPSHEASASYAAELDFYRGLAYLRYRRDPPLAIEALRRATAKDPNDARIWFELANALDGARRYEEAVDAWRHAAALDPSDSRSRRRIAATIGLGDPDGAIEALEANIAAHRHPEAHYATDHLSLAMLRLRRREPTRALEELRMAVRADPRAMRLQIVGWTRGALDVPGIDDAAFWLAVGDLNRDTGGGDTAQAAWRRALASNPDPSVQEALRERLEPR